jgi:hypothetical protein
VFFLYPGPSDHIVNNHVTDNASVFEIIVSFPPPETKLKCRLLWSEVTSMITYVKGDAELYPGPKVVGWVDT